MFGVVAKTARARDRLRSPRRHSVLPETFPRRRWWFDPDGAVALHAPDVVDAPGRAPHAALSVSGSLLAGPGITREADASLLRSLRRAHGAALCQLRGPFVLACWDGALGRLVLARDHLGQRGLFLRRGDDYDVFSDDLEPLLRDPSRACELDFESAFHYLACGLPPPGRTLARGVERVPAAHALTWQSGRPWLEERYWTPLPESPQTFATDEVKAEIQDRLDAAITARLAGGRRQAILLSGGLDSSYLAVTLAARCQVDAYTIEFRGVHGDNEVSAARSLAASIGARHHAVTLDVETAGQLLETTLASPEPCSAWATITHRHLLSRIVEDGHRVVWSGLGSDEVFGGYDRLLRFYFRGRDQVKRWPDGAHVDAFDALLWDVARSTRDLYPGVAEFFSARELARVVRPPYRAWRPTAALPEFYRQCRRIKPGAHLFEMMIAHECDRRIPDLLFVDFERVATELGALTWYPYLDADLIPLVARLGATSRFRHDGQRWWNKRALREIAAARVPREVLERRPASYTAPFVDWIRVPAFYRPIAARLRASGLFRAGLLEPSALDHVAARALNEPRGRRAGRATFQLWALLTLAGWYDSFVERRAPAPAKRGRPG